MRIYDSVLDLIGRTPLINISRYCEKRNLLAEILVKVESNNPGGSVKDRPALFMIEGAERMGLLKVGDTVVEPTSGNTGIGLALVCAVKGYKLVLVMPDTASRERIVLARSYGAEVILTDGDLGMQGAVDKAREIVAERGGYLPDQFKNPDNALAHERTTAKEIIADTDGDIDILVATFGSGGTVSGIGRGLKEYDQSIKIVGVEPASSPLVTEGKSGAHRIQGIGANFLPEILDLSTIDTVLTATDEEAISCARALAVEEGIFVGISSGAALSVATALAKEKENQGKKIVVILPDTGERYLSTSLCE